MSRKRETGLCRGCGYKVRLHKNGLIVGRHYKPGIRALSKSLRTETEIYCQGSYKLSWEYRYLEALLNG